MIRNGLNGLSLFLIIIITGCATSKNNSIINSNELNSQSNPHNVFKYDDDQSDVNFAVMSKNEGQQAAMHFFVGEQKQIIDKVFVYIAGGKIDNIKANIHIIKLDENNLEIVIPFIPYEIRKWNEVNLIKENIIISGNVMIGIEWVTPTGEKEPFTSFFIGTDIDVSNHNGYIKHPNGDWYPARRFGTSGAKNFYIRLWTINL